MRVFCVWVRACLYCIVSYIYMKIYCCMWKSKYVSHFSEGPMDSSSSLTFTSSTLASSNISNERKKRAQLFAWGKTVCSSWNNWKLLRNHHSRFYILLLCIERIKKKDEGRGTSGKASEALDEAIKTVCKQIVNGKSRKNSVAVRAV